MSGNEAEPRTPNLAVSNDSSDSSDAAVSVFLVGTHPFEVMQYEDLTVYGPGRSAIEPTLRVTYKLLAIPEEGPIVVQVEDVANPPGLGRPQGTVAVAILPSDDVTVEVNQSPPNVPAIISPPESRVSIRSRRLPPPPPMSHDRDVSDAETEVCDPTVSSSINKAETEVCGRTRGRKREREFDRRHTALKQLELERKRKRQHKRDEQPGHSRDFDRSGRRITPMQQREPERKRQHERDEQPGHSRDFDRSGRRITPMQQREPERKRHEQPGHSRDFDRSSRRITQRERPPMRHGQSGRSQDLGRYLPKHGVLASAFQEYNKTMASRQPSVYDLYKTSREKESHVKDEDIAKELPENEDSEEAEDYLDNAAMEKNEESDVLSDFGDDEIIKLAERRQKKDTALARRLQSELHFNTTRQKKLSPGTIVPKMDKKVLKRRRKVERNMRRRMKPVTEVPQEKVEEWNRKVSNKRKAKKKEQISKRAERIRLLIWMLENQVRRDGKDQLMDLLMDLVGKSDST